MWGANEMISREVEVYKNGLKHIHYHVPFLKNVSVSFYVKTGSSNEGPPELWGISHFLEHMLFNGNEKYPDQRATDRLISGNGLYQNAWTWYNMTNYYLVGPKEAFPLAFDLLFNRVFYPLLKAKDVEKEKGIIKEEIGMYENNPGVSLYLEAKAQILSETSYCHDVLGTRESVSNFSVDQLRNYHKTFYSSGNISLVTYGGISMDEVREVCSDSLSALTPMEIPDYSSESEKDKGEESEISMQKDTKSSYYIYILLLPVVKTVDQLTAYIILSNILSGGKGSILDQRLLFEDSLVSSYESYFRPFRNHSYIVFEASLSEDKIPQVKEIVKRSLSETLEKIDSKDFVRAKNYAHGEFIRSVEDVYLTTNTNWSNVERLNFLNNIQFEIGEILSTMKNMSEAQFQMILSKGIDLSKSKDGILTPKKS